MCRNSFPICFDESIIFLFVYAKIGEPCIDHIKLFYHIILITVRHRLVIILIVISDMRNVNGTVGIVIYHKIERHILKFRKIGNERKFIR